MMKHLEDLYSITLYHVPNLGIISPSVSLLSSSTNSIGDDFGPAVPRALPHGPHIPTPGFFGAPPGHGSFHMDLMRGGRDYAMLEAGLTPTELLMSS